MMKKVLQDIIFLFLFLQTGHNGMFSQKKVWATEISSKIFFHNRKKPQVMSYLGFFDTSPLWLPQIYPSILQSVVPFI